LCRVVIVIVIIVVVIIVIVIVVIILIVVAVFGLVAVGRGVAVECFVQFLLRNGANSETHGSQATRAAQVSAMRWGEVSGLALKLENIVHALNVKIIPQCGVGYHIRACHGAPP
jgi:hypothetical protein